MKLIVYFSFILSALLCHGQKKVLTEDEFAVIIKKYHPVAQQAAIEVKIAEAEVQSSRGAFDPVLSFGDAGKQLDGTNYYAQRQTEIKVPTWYGIELYGGKEVITGSRINPEETKGTLTYAGFSLPLLQNLLMDKRMAALKQARILREVSELQRRIYVNDLLLEATNVYWEWWEQYHVNQLLESSLQNAQQRFAMVKTAYRLGDRPAIDTLEAFTQIQSFAIKQSESFTALIKARLKLSAFLWAENQRQYELPADVLPQEWTPTEGIAVDDILRMATLNPELTQYQFKLKSQEIDKRLKFQLLLPKLDLKYNQIGYDISKTLNAAWFQNNYRYGVSFSMPLRLSEGRGEYQQARLKIQQTRLEQVNKQVQVNYKVKTYFTEWEQTRSQLAMQTNLLANITALQRGEETRFSNGESSLFLINARELKTLETRQKLIELMAKNRKALLSLRWSAGLIGN